MFKEVDELTTDALAQRFIAFADFLTEKLKYSDKEQREAKKIKEARGKLTFLRRQIALAHLCNLVVEQVRPVYE